MPLTGQLARLTGGLYIDNRDQDIMTGYLEARVEALARRIKELEQTVKGLELINQEQAEVIEALESRAGLKVLTRGALRAR